MDRIVRVKVTNHNSGTYVDEEFPGYGEYASEDVKVKIEDSENGTKIMVWYVEEEG